MQVSPTGLIYHFQMSAVAAVNGVPIEGTLSSVSALSTVYVPNPGKTISRNVHLYIATQLTNK